MSLNPDCPEALSLLLARRSVKTTDMALPGPDSDQIRTILSAAIRVPDHGKLTPWRFIVLTGDDRQLLGDAIAEALEKEGEYNERIREIMRDYGHQAPVCIIAISSVESTTRIPELEQRLSLGAACQNLLIAAHATGFVGQWLTGWGAYSETVQAKLGLKAYEEIGGFIFLGSKGEKAPSERPRPNLDDVVSWGVVSGGKTSLKED